MLIHLQSMINDLDSSERSEDDNQDVSTNGYSYNQSHLTDATVHERTNHLFKVPLIKAKTVHSEQPVKAKAVHIEQLATVQRAHSDKQFAGTETENEETSLAPVKPMTKSVSQPSFACTAVLEGVVPRNRKRSSRPVPYIRTEAPIASVAAKNTPKHLPLLPSITTESLKEVNDRPPLLTTQSLKEGLDTVTPKIVESENRFVGRRKIKSSSAQGNRHISMESTILLLQKEINQLQQEEKNIVQQKDNHQPIVEDQGKNFRVKTNKQAGKNFPFTTTVIPSSTADTTIDTTTNLSTDPTTTTNNTGSEKYFLEVSQEQKLYDTVSDTQRPMMTRPDNKEIPDCCPLVLANRKIPIPETMNPTSATLTISTKDQATINGASSLTPISPESEDEGYERASEVISSVYESEPIFQNQEDMNMVKDRDPMDYEQEDISDTGDANSRLAKGKEILAPLSPSVSLPALPRTPTLEEYSKIKPQGQHDLMHLDNGNSKCCPLELARRKIPIPQSPLTNISHVGNDNEDNSSNDYDDNCSESENDINKNDGKNVEDNDNSEIENDNDSKNIYNDDNNSSNNINYNSSNNSNGNANEFKSEIEKENNATIDHNINIVNVTDNVNDDNDNANENESDDSANDDFIDIGNNQGRTHKFSSKNKSKLINNWKPKLTTRKIRVDGKIQSEHDSQVRFSSSFSDSSISCRYDSISEDSMSLSRRPLSRVRPASAGAQVAFTDDFNSSLNHEHETVSMNNFHNGVTTEEDSISTDSLNNNESIYNNLGGLNDVQNSKIIPYRSRSLDKAFLPTSGLGIEFATPTSAATSSDSNDFNPLINPLPDIPFSREVRPRKSSSRKAMDQNRRWNVVSFSDVERESIQVQQSVLQITKYLSGEFNEDVEEEGQDYENLPRPRKSTILKSRSLTDFSAFRIRNIFCEPC
eukprot:Awhi_evm1s13976